MFVFSKNNLMVQGVALLIGVGVLVGAWLSGASPLLLALLFCGFLTALCMFLAWQVCSSRDQLDTIREILDISDPQVDLVQHTSNVKESLRHKERLLGLNVVNENIKNSEELSVALERIVSVVIELLGATSVELALYDTESAMYHSALCVGIPLDSSAQAMLAGAAEGESDDVAEDIVVERMSFAGSELGSLRVMIKRGVKPTKSERELIKAVALQAGIAILNAEYTSELMRLKTQSEDSIKAKTGFLANLSHELRGPLGIMLNAVELVHDGLCGDLNEDQLETLSMVKGNGEHLLELVNDVLDYAKIESGRLNPEFTTIRLKDLISDVYAIVRSQAEAKSQKFVVEFPDEHIGIEADKRHMRQMLINLLTNAVKYTKDGGSIELYAERTTEKNITINVKDTGVGIPESEQHKVFAAFERVDDQYSKKQVGTGLGMPLTKSLAEANGGHIDFSSTQGIGSHFWISFPTVDVTEDAAIEEEQLAEETKIANGELVLLMESNKQERSVLSRYLRHRGFEIVFAEDVTLAEELLQTRNITIGLIDNRILEQTTDGVLHSLRKASGNPHLPLVLLSSRAFSFDIEHYLRSGIDICLSKPLDLAELASTCYGAIQGKQNSASL